jgi:hypothetical protein
MLCLVAPRIFSLNPDYLGMVKMKMAVTNPAAKKCTRNGTSKMGWDRVVLHSFHQHQVRT